MTERWRKKLGDLDATGPNDDVLARAHQGPTQPDPQIDLPSTSTKVITGVAAFLVFALAISVFAIPALRMRNGGPASPGAMQLPLWPARSLDNLEALQAQADAGDANARWFLDPDLVGQRFAADVLGWDGVRTAVVRSSCPTVPTSAAGAASYSDTCSIVGVGTPMGSSRSAGLFTTAAPGSVAEMWLSFAGSCTALCPTTPIRLTLFQPVDVGEGGIWAVREVHGGETSIGAAGGQLRPGESIYIGTRVFENEVPTLAYHVGPGSCDVDYATSEVTSLEGMRDTVGMVLPVEHGCAEPTPGYVWFATAAESLIANDESAHVADPFAEGGVMLTSLTAVPVTFAPETPSGTFEPPTMAPTHFSDTGTPVAVNLETYESDPRFGWTIDRPAGAEPRPVDDGVTLPIGDGLFVTILRISGAAPADDSSYPLDPATPDGSFSGYTVDFTFRGDGQAFEFFVSSEEGGQLDLSDDQRAIVEQMLRSIRFEPWDRNGETRNGWASIPGYPTSAGWVNLGKGVYVAFREESNEGFRVFGPVESCGEGQNMAVTQGGTVAVQECPDGSQVEFTYDDGGGEPERLVIVSHDGARLVRLP